MKLSLLIDNMFLGDIVLFAKSLEPYFEKVYLVGETYDHGYKYTTDKKYLEDNRVPREKTKEAIEDSDVIFGMSQVSIPSLTALKRDYPNRI